MTSKPSSQAGPRTISTRHQAHNHGKMNKLPLYSKSFPVTSHLLWDKIHELSLLTFSMASLGILGTCPSENSKATCLGPRNRTALPRARFPTVSLSFLLSLLKHLYQFLCRTSHSPNFPLSLLAGPSQAPLMVHSPSPDFET